MACCGGKDNSKELEEMEEKRRKLEEELRQKELDRKKNEDELAEERKRRAALEAAEGEDAKKRRLAEEARLAEEERKRKVEEDRKRRLGATEAEKIRLLEKKKQAILTEAQRLLDTEKKKTNMQKLSETEVATLYQQYIIDFRACQLPFTSFALMEATAWLAFGQMAKCDHFGKLWLSVDTVVNLFACMLFVLFMSWAVSPIERALSENPYMWGQKIKDLYSDAASQMTTGSSMDFRSLKPEHRSLLRNLVMVLSQMAGYSGPCMYLCVVIATGGFWFLICSIWIPAWSAVALIREVPLILTFFLASCDPTLDMAILCFVVARALFILYSGYCMYKFYASSGYTKEFIIEQSDVHYYQRMEAGLGMQTADTKRWNWWPDSLKPVNYRELQNIDDEIRDIEEAMKQPLK